MSEKLFFKLSTLSDEQRREARASFQKQNLAVYEAVRVMHEQAAHVGESIARMFAQPFGAYADVWKAVQATRDQAAASAVGSIARLFGTTEAARTSAAQAIAGMMRHAQSECFAASALAAALGPKADVEAEGVM